MGYDTTSQLSPNHSASEYWAAASTDEVGPFIKEKIDGYYMFVRAFGRLPLWHKSYNQYYINVSKAGALDQIGVAGEFMSLNVNHYHNLIAHLKSLITSSRPSFEARATNTDYESMAQCIIAEGLLDYYMRAKGLESNIATAVEHALIFGEGFVRYQWDGQSGKEYGMSDEGTPIYEGDLSFTNFTPLDVIRDYSKLNAHEDDWRCVRTFKNKYTLAAKFPHIKDMILGSPTRQDIQKDLLFTIPMLFKDTDDIIVYEFYHNMTAALPKGRMTWINDSGEVILDGNLPYRKQPIIRMAAEEQVETPFGFTSAFDLLNIQENLDNMFSTIATNQNAFGVQNIIVEQGTGFSAPDLYGAVKLLTKPQGASDPKVLELLATPAEIFKFIDSQIQYMETLSGINSVARGQPEPSLKSGAALAMVQSMAIQFYMPMQLSYTRLIEKLGVGIIDTLKDYASVPRVAEISGKSKRSYLKEFTNKDIDRIDRVVVDLGNPLDQTTAGRLTKAETLLQNKMVNADQYVQIMDTGTFDTIIEGPEAELMLIREENEELMDGKDTMVLFTDMHQQHIQEHRVISASVDARKNPKAMEAMIKHLQDHIDMLKNPQYQNFLQLCGENPIPPQQAPQPPQGEPPQQPMPPVNPGTAGKPIQPPSAIRPIINAGQKATGVMASPVPLQAQTTGKVNGIALPSGPRNPMTGQKTVLPSGVGRNTKLSGKVKPPK